MDDLRLRSHNVLIGGNGVGKSRFVDYFLMLIEMMSGRRYGRARRRLVPIVQMYEFEVLLFSDPQAFSKEINRAELSQSLVDIAEQFASLEHINDSPQNSSQLAYRSIDTWLRKIFNWKPGRSGSRLGYDA